VAVDQEQLRAVIAGCVEGASAHLIELRMGGDKGKPLIEVFIDAEQGVTTELCAAVSRSVAAAIEGNDAVGANYGLNVSSPGIDRPLAFPWQYPKHVGRTLRVMIRDAGKPIERSGTLVAVDSDGFALEERGGGTAVRIAFDTVAEARVVAPW
jgi:ribosome maturation factor RimP